MNRNMIKQLEQVVNDRIQVVSGPVFTVKFLQLFNMSADFHNRSQEYKSIHDKY